MEDNQSEASLTFYSALTPGILAVPPLRQRGCMSGAAGWRVSQTSPDLGWPREVVSTHPRSDS